MVQRPQPRPPGRGIPPLVTHGRSAYVLRTRGGVPATRGGRLDPGQNDPVTRARGVTVGRVTARSGRPVRARECDGIESVTNRNRGDSVWSDRGRAPQDHRARPSRHEPGLDGIRAVAVIGVLGFHAGWPAGGGLLGVDIFFVLSGYLITSLLVAEWGRTGTVGSSVFRAARPSSPPGSLPAPAGGATPDGFADRTHSGRFAVMRSRPWATWRTGGSCSPGRAISCTSDRLHPCCIRGRWQSRSSST